MVAFGIPAVSENFRRIAIVVKPTVYASDGFWNKWDSNATASTGRLSTSSFRSSTVEKCKSDRITAAGILNESCVKKKKKTVTNGESTSDRCRQQVFFDKTVTAGKSVLPVESNRLDAMSNNFRHLKHGV